MPLTPTELDILAMENLWWQHSGAKDAEIRKRFDMSATRYHQVLNALIDREDAMAHDPIVVKRLRRVRSTRQRSRGARSLGIVDSVGDDA